MSNSQSSNIYCIYRHTSPSGKHYIGQTNNYSKRNAKHKSQHNKCRLFSAAIKKYGWDNFTHEILEENLTLDQANEMEVFYIELNNSLAPNGYNLTTGGLNYTPLEETKEKLREANLGKKHTEETIKKMSESQKGKKHSEESIEKMRNSKKYCSEELREKRRKIWTGKNHSEETKRKMSDAKKGRKISDETKLKMSKSNKGKRLGIKVSEETKSKNRKEWHIITPENKHLIIEDIQKFCNENNFFKYTSITGLKRTNGIYKGHKIYNIDKRHK